MEGTTVKKEILVEGMSCGHCVKRIENALKGLEEVESVLVSLEDKKAEIVLKEQVSDDKLKEVIEDAGYDVIEIKNL